MGRRRASGKTAYANSEKSGRGRGTGENYEPWLKVTDVTNSAGMRSRFFSLKCGRMIHVLSRSEKLAFLHFDWREDVVAIYEQYALDPDAIQAIAEELKYPVPGYSQQDGFVMTTDLLVRIRRPSGRCSMHAYQVKSSRKDIEGSRTKQKLAIEQEYWKRKGVEWEIIFAEDFNPIFSANLDRLSNQRNLVYSAGDLSLMIDIVSTLQAELLNVAVKQLREATIELSSNRTVSAEDMLLALAAKKRISFAIETKPIDSCVLKDFQIPYV